MQEEISILSETSFIR